MLACLLAFCSGNNLVAVQYVDFVIKTLLLLMRTVLLLFSTFNFDCVVQTDAELGKEIEQKLNDKMAEMKKM